MATSEVERHPDWINPDFDLIGVDSNAFSIMGAVGKALRRAGNNKVVIDTYMEQAQSGDYDNLLRVSVLYAGMND